MRYGYSIECIKSQKGCEPVYFELDFIVSFAGAACENAKRPEFTIRKLEHLSGGLKGPGPVDRWKNIMKRNVVRLTYCRKGGRCYA